MFLFPKKNYYKPILKLALPAIAGLSTQMILSLVDSAIVGRLGDAQYALAAMGIGVLMTWALISFFSSLSTGTHVLIARKYGKKDYDECANILNNSLYIGLGLGIIVAVFAVLGAHHFARFIAKDARVGQYAGDFLFYRFLGIPFFLLTVSYRGFYFGINKVKVFMISGIITNLLNILFNYVLVFGKLGIPAMGVAGSGLGSSLATVFDFLFYFTISTFPAYRHKYRIFRNFKFNRDIIKEIFRIALPVSFQNVFILVGFLSFMALMGVIGLKEQAASQAVISSLFLSFLPCFGFGIASQTLVGNNIGSRKFAVAKIYGYETAKLATYYTVFIGLVFIIFPYFTLTIITEDKSIIGLAAPALRIAGFAQIFYATGVVLANGLQAANRTFFVMMSEVVSNLFIFVPLSFLLGKILGLGMYGAWSALPVYIILYSSILFWKFRRDNWEHIYS